MNEYSIIPECYGDTLLIKTIGYKSANHKHGIGEVNNTMKKYFVNKPAIGIIDNDKKSIPSDFNKFTEIERKHNLILKRESNSRHFLIVINPALEDWIESVGNSLGIKRPYPKNRKEYRKVMKSFMVDKNPQITSYFNSIKQKNPPALRTMKKWIDDILK